jgi:plastocyanin
VTGIRIAAVLTAFGAIAAALFVAGPREAPAAARAGEITMGHEAFNRSVVTIRAGQRLTFSNTSHWLHVIVPGKEARLDTQPGLPSFGPRKAHLSERGNRWVTAPWNAPGTYWLTCQLHPEMTLEVRVLASKASAGDRPT